MPDRASAEGDKFLGSFKEGVGSVAQACGIDTGKNNLKAQGTEQRQKGEAEYKAAQASDAAEATKDTVVGGAKKHIGGLFSDKQHDKGEAQLKAADVKEEKSKH